MTIPVGLTVNDLVLSKSLALGITEWFKQNIYFNEPVKLFKQFFNYPRIDIPASEMTAVSIYTVNPDTKKYPKYEVGQVAIEVTFNLQKQRSDRAKQIYDTMETIRGQLMNNPVYLQTYLQDYTPGLQWIQSQNTIETSKYRDSLLKREGSTTIPIYLDYRIGILSNQRALWALGYDYYSTGTVVYEENDDIVVDINTQNN